MVIFHISPASEIAKNIGIPKSSVNFLADTLWQQGYLKKSFRGKTGYFEVDIDCLQESIYTHLSRQEQALESLLPELKQKIKFTNNKPKITFLE